MDLADFVPPAMLPTRVQNANLSLSQRHFKIAAGRRDRDNSEPDIILCFHAPILPPLRCFLKNRPDRLKDVRWRATPSALLSRGLARGSREAGRLPDPESPSLAQSRCCSATDSGGTTDIRSSQLNTQPREHAYPTIAPSSRSFPRRQRRV